MRARTKRLAQYLYLAGFCLITVLITAGCSPSRTEIPLTHTPYSTATATTTPSSFPPPSFTPQPSRTPVPHTKFIPTSTVTPTQTNTPYPPLSQHGPYLAYLKNNSLILLNADGNGRKIIDLPENGYITNLERALSPDKKWIVIYQGTPSIYSGIEITPELSINLLYTPDGTIHRITSLFPENPVDLVNTGGYNLFIKYEWSPDGRYLAFTGAMDGRISDLYVYDIETEAIRRLTDNTVSIWLINWSPDSNWIWFESAEIVPPGDLISFYIMKFDESFTHYPTLLLKTIWTQGFWISPTSYLLYNTPDGGCGLNNFRYINITTGQETVIWQNPASSFAIDQNNKLLAVSTECGEPGTFLVDWYGNMYVKLSENPFGLEPWGGQRFSFLGSDYDKDQTFGIDRDGSMTLLSDKYFSAVSVSPDNHWFTLHQDPNYSDSPGVGMDLFSENNQYVRTITDQHVYDVAWNLDSTGLFYFDNSLRYIAIPDGQPILLDDCKPDGCDRHFVWLP